jgi:hypothetical protein
MLLPKFCTADSHLLLFARITRKLRSMSPN